MKIGVVSDTHVPQVARELPASLLTALDGCDLILHAGDITSPEVLETLATLAPVTAVRGNMDEPAPGLPVSRLLTCAGRSIGLVHGHGAPGEVPSLALAQFPGADVVVFGHTHLPCCVRRGTTLLFNPGTPTDPRFSSRFTCGILELGDSVSGMIVDLP